MANRKLTAEQVQNPAAKVIVCVTGVSGLTKTFVVPSSIITPSLSYLGASTAT